MLVSGLPAAQVTMTVEAAPTVASWREDANRRLSACLVPHACQIDET
jgi:hypothetical protein